MKKLIWTGILVLAGYAAIGQTFPDYPAYPVPSKYLLKSGGMLPPSWDNSGRKYFPSVFDQYGYSCNQASSIGYVFTYELNRLRDVASNIPENLYSPGFTWNFTNSSNWGVGVSYFDSYEIVKTAGSPNYIDYPYYLQGTGIWMSGYDKYYRAMQNRILVNYSMPVGTPESLEIFKNYLVDHLEGSPDGGVGSFQISSDRMDTHNWNNPETGENWPVIWTFGNNVGHAMTFVGYNDSVRVDLNNDGEYTNDVDINHDGKVNMRDWEIGAFLAVNSWGKGWGKGGKSYVLYSVVAREGNEGGIWNRSVHVIKAIKEYDPQLTMRVAMRHESRNKFRVLAGISTDTASAKPQQVIPFPLFNYQGGDQPLQDPENQEDPGRFELGLDLTRFLTDIDPGVPVKFFLIIEEKDPANSAAGQIDEFSVIHYYNGQTEEVARQKNVQIVNNGLTYLSLVRDLDFDKVQVIQPAGNSIPVGQQFDIQLEAEGGQPPYRWELVKDYTQKAFTRTLQDISGDTLSDLANEKPFKRVDLPFEFPYYGEKFKFLYADIKGALHFNNEYFDYPYAIDQDLYFKVRKSIVPFGADVQVNVEGDRLVCKLTDSVAVFQWHASVYKGLRVYPVDFSAFLYPDGSIEFLYGKRSRPPQTDYEWVSGISNGDGRLFKYSLVNETRLIFENYGIRFSPLDYPDDLRLTDQGLLSGIARDSGRIWNIYVKVSDLYNQTRFAAVPINTIDWEKSRILKSNYPNPFNRFTNFELQVPEETEIRLEVFDLSGRKVKELVNRTLTAGEYTFYWNTKDEHNRDLDSGLYIYRLRAGDKTESGKMTLIR